MNYKKASYNVYITTDYSIFKPLEGNRAIVNQRAERILKSIQEVGWIRNPIIVNEKYEVVDGQGRLTALQKLGKPVEFIIDEGVGVNECRAMNNNQQKWTSSDFINSYVACGNRNYINFKKLWNNHKGMSIAIIQFALKNKYPGGNDTRALMEGNLVCTDEQYQYTNEILDEIMKLKPIIDSSLDGRKDLFYYALIFVYNKKKNYDIARVESVVRKKIKLVPPIGTLAQAFQELEAIYNKNCRGAYANFLNDYKEYCRSNGYQIQAEKTRKGKGQHKY